MRLFNKTQAPYIQNNLKTFFPKKCLALFFLALILSLLLSACFTGSSLAPQVSSARPDPAKKTIYTSIYSVYDFTKKIAGDDFNLVLLMPPGTEAHDWEPGPQDMAKLSKADALIFSGAGMEPWVEQVAAAGDANLVLLDSSKDVPLIEAHAETSLAHEHEIAANTHEANTDTHEHGQFDPHIWLDPRNVKIQMQNIAALLSQVEPSKKDAIEKRLTDEKVKLDALDKKFSETLKDYAGKTVIVSHEAFAYLFKAYGFRQLGIEGLLASSEPSPGHMADLIKLAKAEAIKVIYVEPLSSHKTAESLAAEIGGRVEILDPFEGLTAEQEAAGKDYYSVMESNLNTLLNGFEGR